MGLTTTMITQLNNMNAAAQRAQLGTLLGAFGPIGDVYYLDPTNGSDSYDGKSPSKAVATMPVAYALLVDGHNDVLVYIADTTGLTLSAAVVWAKSYTHLIGLCAPTRIGQRARIFQLAGLTGASPLITVSGSGCIFRDLYAFQGVNDATSLINVSVTGGRNYFENVHFAGGGHATQAVDGGASLLLNGGAENLFKNCTIGVDTIAAGTGMNALLIDGDAKRNIFEDCNFLLYAGHTGASFVEVADSAAFDRFILFKNCNFINDSTAYSIASAFVIPSGMGSVTHRLLMKDCMGVGITKWDASDRGILYGNMDAITGADLSGVAVQMIT